MLTPVKFHKAEKYAINRKTLADSSRIFFMKNFGCRRKVRNLLVNELYDRLEDCGYKPGDLIPEFDYSEVSDFKKHFPFLKEADSLALANARIDFKSAVKRFNDQSDHKTYTKRAIRRDKSGAEKLSFRGLKGMPKFLSKARGDFSYTTNCQYPSPGNGLKQPTIRLTGRMLHLPKMKEDVELIIHRPLPEDAVIGNVTISMDIDGALYAAIEYTYTLMMDTSLRDAAVNDNASILKPLKVLGLDYSQPDFYVDSEGRKANYPHYYRKSEEKLARLQKQLSRMQKGSSNYDKELEEIRKLHRKIRNQRCDFIRKEASYLASTYDVVVVEDIDLRAMGGGLSLGKNLHDNGFGMFRTRLSEKLEAKGSVLVKVDKWYPSTKTCSKCGHVNPDIKLGDREWTCPVCGTHHMRDDNAAVNIREEGIRILLSYLREHIQEETLAKARAEALSTARKTKKKKKKAA